MLWVALTAIGTVGLAATCDYGSAQLNLSTGAATAARYTCAAAGLLTVGTVAWSW